MSMFRIGRPRLRWILLFIVIILPSADCFFRDEWHIAEGPAPAEFEELPGSIGITFWIDGQDPTPPVHMLVRNGAISQTDQLPPARYSAVAGGMKSFDSWMPKRVSGLTIVPSGPFLQSTDESLIAAAAELAPGQYLLVIFDAQTLEIRGHVDMTGGEAIRAIAWSPDSRYVAVITGTWQTSFCLGEIVGAFAGHPSSLSSSSLHVYDVNGRPIAVQNLTSRSHWGEQLVWLK